MTKYLLLLLVVLPVAGSGCSSTIARLTLISTKNVDFQGEGSRQVVARGTEESEGRFWILFIPFGSAPSGLRIVDTLLADHEADYLTNVHVTGGGWTLLVAGHEWVAIEADAWQTGGVEPEPPAPTPEGTTKK